MVDLWKIKRFCWQYKNGGIAWITRSHAAHMLATGAMTAWDRGLGGLVIYERS